MAEGKADAVEIRRVRRRRELLALLDPYEPRATPIIVDVEALGVVPWRTRAWVVERGGRPAAIVVLSRAAIDRWFARCVLIDEAAAPSVAAIVDRSSAWIVTGSGLDVGPVHPHLRRERGLAGMPWVVVEHPAHVIDRPPDDSLVRVADRSDRAALRALYRGYELAIGETAWQERSAMRTLLRSRTVFVAEEAGRMIAAVMVGGPTARYLSIDRLTVLPEFRTRGLSWEVLAPVQRLVVQRGVGATAAIASSNPMEFGEELLSAHWWLTVMLREPSRFRGQRRLRAAAARVAAVRRREPSHTRAVDPTVPRR